MGLRFRAVTFDLLTALLDSWSLWDEVAGNTGAGSRWREAQLRLVAGSGPYRPFEQIVAEAAREVGIEQAMVKRLLDRWSELKPYADVSPVLKRLREADLKMLILTNCSHRLAQLAAANLLVGWDGVVSAEQAGFYKPHPGAYEAGQRAAGHPAAEVLFVPGSPTDLTGAEKAGHGTYWVNRRQVPLPLGTYPIAIERTLDALPKVIGL